jgi:hypothetical protein
MKRTLVAALLLVAGAGAHAQQIDREQLEKRVAAVETLIERSSAARQIEASGDARARAHRDKARDIHARAVAALRAGDLATASRLLPDASVQMFEGVRLAGADAVVAEKRRADFDARLESVKALAAAQQRIALEKKSVPGSAETAKAIDDMVGQAQQLAANGDLEAARAVLDRAYLVAKAAIGSMRSGDTLVRSLDFASKEEEYRYELDRNDTHLMLLRLLVADPAKAERAGASSAKAAQLRSLAEGRASSGAFAEAVGLLEESTRELVRAIRGAGVYIPG